MLGIPRLGQMSRGVAAGSRSRSEGHCHLKMSASHVCLLLVFMCLPSLSVAAGGEELNRVACQDHLLGLTCPYGEILRISRAVFGRFTRRICNKDGVLDMNLACNQEESQNIVANKCDGRETCEVLASTDVFGDPCPDTSKYLQVYYKCELKVTEPPHRPHPDLNVGDSQFQKIDKAHIIAGYDGSPQEPVLLYATPVNATAVEISWLAPSNAPIKNTRLHYRTYNAHYGDTRDLSKNRGENREVVGNLQPNTLYMIYIKCSNDHGFSPNSNTMTVTTPELGRARQPIDNPPRAEHLTPDPDPLSSTTSSTDSYRGAPTTTARSRSRSMSSSRAPAPETAPERIPSTTTRDPGPDRDKGGHDLFPDMTKEDKTSPQLTVTTTVEPPARTSSGEDPDVGTDHQPPPFTDRGPGRRREGEGDSDSNPGQGNLQMTCLPVEHQGVLWPQTRPGQVAEEPCPNGLEGMSSWRCAGQSWASLSPDLSECVSPWLSALDKQVTNMMGGEEEPMTAMKALQEEITNRGKRLLPGDLKRLAYKMLPKLSRRMLAKREKNKEEIKEFQEAVVWTSSQLLAESNAESWAELSTRDCRRSATSLVNQLEETGFEVADNLAIGESSVETDRNVVLKATRIDTQTHHSDLTFPSPGDLSQSPAWRDTKNWITIPSTSLKIAGRKGPLSVVFTVYNNLEELMEPLRNQGSPTSGENKPSLGTGASDGDNAEEGEDDDDTNDMAAAEPLMVINSRIIAASMGSSRMRRILPEPVSFTLEHLHPTDNSRPVCSFWEIDTVLLSGRWSQDGCRLVYGNRSHTVCECDHLTNFAVLMDVRGVELSEENELALRVITYVGCIISIICLLLAWITFTIFKNLQCDRNTIHKNLVLTLLLAEVLFVGGIAQTQPRLLCALIAGGLHFLFLSAFAWMCLEGVQLYVMLVQVFEHERSRVTSYYLFGYGVPLVVVAVSAAVYRQGYGTDTHCWLTTDHYFVMSFVGPACAVILINAVMLSIAIYTMCRHSNMSATMKERSKVNKFSSPISVSSLEAFAPPKLRFPELPAWLKGAVVLVVLLGLTWAFGLLYLSNQTVAWAYVFTVLNSLQGLFIFVFHCLKNDKVQKEYRKVARHTTWLPNCIRVNYGGYTVRSSTSRPNSTGSGNYLSKLFGGRRKSAASTNSSAKPFLSSDQQRKSDIDNSGSRCSANCESSNIPPPSPHPTLLNGYVYNPSYTHLNGYTTTSVTNSNVMVAPHSNIGCSQQHNHQLAPCYEEVVGELSQVLDCSLVDSEMVTEYCHNNLQVSQEKRRYSTGSEDSVSLLPTPAPQPPVFLDPDNLSTVSMASSSVVHGSTQALPSSASFPSDQHNHGEDQGDGKGRDEEGEPLYEEVRMWPAYTHGNGGSGDGHGMPEGFDPRLNLHQYIIPSSDARGSEGRGEPAASRLEANVQSNRPRRRLPDPQFCQGISEPSVSGGKESNPRTQPSASNPISFTNHPAAAKSKPEKANGAAVPPRWNDNNRQMNSAILSSQPGSMSGKLELSCGGPLGSTNCRSSPVVGHPGQPQSTSEC